MKINFCLFCVLVVAASYLVGGHSIADMQKIAMECKNKTGLTKDVSREIPDFDDAEVKCFSACVMKKLGVLAGGRVIPEKFVQATIRFIPPLSENTAEKLMSCVSLANQQSDECEVASVLGRCTVKNFSPQYT